MDLKSIVSMMTPEIRENLSRAVEIGRWADGNPLTEQQKSSSMQAVIAWDAYKGENTDEPFKVQKGGEFNMGIKKPEKAAEKIVLEKEIISIKTIPNEE